MKYYKDTNGEVFAFEADGSQDYLIDPSLVLMTQAEVNLHLNPPKTPAQLAEEAKIARELAVSQIKVTTTSGKSFNGDETSQTRMARAVASSIAGETTSWILADNTVATVTHEELKEALRLAGQAQTAIWIA